MLGIIVFPPLFSEPHSIEEALASTIHPKVAGNRIGYIAIDDKDAGINQSTWMYVKAALDYYKQHPPLFVILKLNTPGGELYPAQNISNALKELDIQYSIPVVAFIDNWAISAGAMLAYSCRFIAITSDASMGAAEPLETDGKESHEASEKVNSAVRSFFANLASFYGRNPLIAKGMVDKDLILVIRGGEVVALDNETQIISSGESKDTLLKAKGKLLTLNAEELMRYKVADISLPPAKLKPITAMELEQGKWPASQMLLFTDPWFAKIPDAEIDAYLPDWKTRFFALLSNNLISSLLFMGLLLGFYVEISGGGFGIAGTIGVTCLILILLSSFAQEAYNWLELILLLVGAGIIAIDLFVLPTFGLLGAIGVLFMVAGLLGLLLPGLSAVDYDFSTQTMNAAGEFVFQRFIFLCIAFILSVVCMYLLARFVLPRRTPFDRFILKGNEQDPAKGFYAGENPANMPQPGAQGHALSVLRPSGKVLIAGKVYDAFTSGAYLEASTPIEVVRLEGSSLLVKEKKAKTP